MHTTGKKHCQKTIFLLTRHLNRQQQGQEEAGEGREPGQHAPLGPREVYLLLLNYEIPSLKCKSNLVVCLLSFFLHYRWRRKHL